MVDFDEALTSRWHRPKKTLEDMQAEIASSAIRTPYEEYEDATLQRLLDSIGLGDNDRPDASTAFRDGPGTI